MRDHNWNNIADRLPIRIKKGRDTEVVRTHLLNNLEAELIISVNHILVDKSENRHHSVNNRLRREACHIPNQEKSLIERLRVFGYYETSSVLIYS